MNSAFVQDKRTIERGLFDEELVPEELTQVRMGKIVRDKFPHLDEEDQEAVRQHAVAALNIKTSRRITTPDHGPLFSQEEDEGDSHSGFIYVLRSLSDHPFISANREVIHKIGVTGGEVKKRTANAKKDPTFLLAEVEIMETYKLSNIDRSRLERLLHRFLAPARLDLGLKDRFDFGVEPQEWFLAPLPVIREVIERLMDGSIENCRYDPKSAQIVVGES